MKKIGIHRASRLTPLTPARKDSGPRVELAITEVTGHLTYTASAVTAWYELPEHVWAFRPDAEREALLGIIAEQYAGLAGCRLHLRRTTRPFPVAQWADHLTGSSVPPADVPGAPSWADHVAAATKHLADSNHTEGQTYLGIQFARRRLGDTAGEWLRRRFGKGVTVSEQDAAAEKAAEFDTMLAAAGLGARRASVESLSWLLTRSIGLSLTPPDHPATDLGPDDILALSEHVETYRTRYGSTVRFVNRLTGETRYVAVLTVGRMEPLTIPEKHDPWLHLADRAPFPVEISSRVDVLGPDSSGAALEKRLRMIRNQQTDYADHNLDAPPELDRLANRALEVGDEIATGLPSDSSRVHGWHRIAVFGVTEAECMERVAELTRIYQTTARITLRHPKGQPELCREFIPGEPLADAGYLRRMPVRVFAAALPQATASVGDRHGDLIGATAGTARRPVFLDAHFPMEVRERSGLQVLVSEPGGGKSTLMGALGYLAARRGAQVTLLDPSGPLSRLGNMPEMAPHTRVINLAGCRPGVLAPYALIPTPRKEDYAGIRAGDPAAAGEDVDSYSYAKALAQAERKLLALDVCQMLLPPQVVHKAEFVTVLRRAIRAVPPEVTTAIDDIIDQLDDLGVDGKEVAELLRDAQEMPLASLLFGTPPPGAFDADVPLSIITMAGLRLPDLNVDRNNWSAEEALALPLLYTAQRLAARRCYGGDMNSRKLVGLDEAHFMQGWPSGRSFLIRLSRDSRKWNIAALVASQNPKDILGLDVQNLVSTVFVGRIAKDQEVAAGALQMLGVPTGVGYEQTLAALSQADTATNTRLGFREFVMRDVDDRVQKIRIDLSYVDGLLTHLDTTPGGTR